MVPATKWTKSIDNDSVLAYIDHRQTCLTDILTALNEPGGFPEDLPPPAILLWNRELFFEFHEWLEAEWIQATGSRKKCLQALILASVVYEQLLYHRPGPARKNAQKALLLLEAYGRELPAGFDIELLKQKLTDPDPIPPRFRFPLSDPVFYKDPPS